MFVLWLVAPSVGHGRSTEASSYNFSCTFAIYAFVHFNMSPNRVFAGFGHIVAVLIQI